jgi:hypothetical protein
MGLAVGPWVFLFVFMHGGIANGWPGLSQEEAFSVIVCSSIFLTVLLGGSAIAIVLCALLQRQVRRDFVGWLAFVLTMVLWSVVAAIFSAGWFTPVRDRILRDKGDYQNHIRREELEVPEVL